MPESLAVFEAQVTALDEQIEAWRPGWTDDREKAAASDGTPILLMLRLEAARLRADLELTEAMHRLVRALETRDAGA